MVVDGCRGMRGNEDRAGRVNLPAHCDRFERGKWVLSTGQCVQGDRDSALSSVPPPALLLSVQISLCVSRSRYAISVFEIIPRRAHKRMATSFQSLRRAASSASPNLTATTCQNHPSVDAVRKHSFVHSRTSHGRTSAGTRGYVAHRQHVGGC